MNILTVHKLVEEFYSPAGKNCSDIMCVAYIMCYYLSHHVSSVFSRNECMYLKKKERIKQ